MAGGSYAIAKSHRFWKRSSWNVPPFGTSLPPAVLSEQFHPTEAARGNMAAPFTFLAAFDRNLGWLADWEQLALRGKRVAVAGMGGVGGFHFLTLARLGVGAFSIADLDHFEIANFNRQVG